MRSDLLTQAITDALTAGLPATTKVGKGKAPSTVTYPYVILYPGIADAERDRGLSGGVPAVIDRVYQMDCVGKSVASCEVTADLALAIVLDPATDLGGGVFKVSNRRFLISTWNDDSDQAVEVKKVRFSLWASPIL